MFIFENDRSLTVELWEFMNQNEFLLGSSALELKNLESEPNFDGWVELKAGYNVIGWIKIKIEFTPGVKREPESTESVGTQQDEGLQTEFMPKQLKVENVNNEIFKCVISRYPS